MFDWDNFLTLAKKVSAMNNNETDQSDQALLRTAVSRAYYAMYHRANDFAFMHLSYSPPTENKHQNLSLFYKRDSSTQNKEIGRLLASLHKSRKDCDYEPEVGNLKDLLENTIVDADRANTLLNP